jgi:hypothetical protein
MSMNINSGERARVKLMIMARRRNGARLVISHRRRVRLAGMQRCELMLEGGLPGRETKILSAWVDDRSGSFGSSAYTWGRFRVSVPDKRWCSTCHARKEGMKSSGRKTMGTISANDQG